MTETTTETYRIETLDRGFWTTDVGEAEGGDLPRAIAAIQTGVEECGADWAGTYRIVSESDGAVVAEYEVAA